MRWLHLVLFLALTGSAAVGASLREQALAAEARLDSARALQLFLELQRENPTDGFVLQKIAQQYSDLVVDQPDLEAKRRYARTALEWAERAVQADPTNAVNVLSLAVCHGKLATLSDTRTKVRYSRLVREDAERALQLDPNYAWAHHLLGRWHREVAELGGTARVFVRVFYGALPTASLAKAVTHLERAVTLEPDNLNHVLELGFAYAAAGQRERARTEWTRGLAMPVRGKHDQSAKQRAQGALARLD